MATYRGAGVDLEAADRAVDRIDAPVTATWGNDVIGSFGGFAAGIRVPGGFIDPVLMMSTDGVGTKAEVAALNVTLPQGVSMEVAYDSSEFVEAAIDEVWLTLGIAFLTIAPRTRTPRRPLRAGPRGPRGCPRSGSRSFRR